MNYLLSYNHSGNTWIRYCVEYLTQYPTHGHKAFSISERNNNFLNVDLTQNSILIKRHELSNCELKSEDNVILIIRNPGDAIKKNLDVNIEFKKYYDLIIQYENFTGKKMLIKYDYLFCIDIIKNIIKFYNMEVNLDRLENLTNNFLQHQIESKKIYHNKLYEIGVGIENLNFKEIEHVRKYI